MTKNGKEYTDAYYHYVENGKKRTKYIPKSLLDRVCEAESRSLPVTDNLDLKKAIKIVTPVGEVELYPFEDTEGYCIKINGSSTEVIEELPNRVIVAMVKDSEVDPVNDCNVSNPADLFL